MEKEGCSGYLLSACCNATIKWGDICTDCLEHCDNMCTDCDETECEENQEKKSCSIQPDFCCGIYKPDKL